MSVSTAGSNYQPRGLWPERPRIGYDVLSIDGESKPSMDSAQLYHKTYRALDQGSKDLAAFAAHARQNAKLGWRAGIACAAIGVVTAAAAIPVAPWVAAVAGVAGGVYAISQSWRADDAARASENCYFTSAEVGTDYFALEERGAHHNSVDPIDVTLAKESILNAAGL